MSKKLTINFVEDKFNDFISKLQDITNIEDTLKIKIEKDNILIYSMISNGPSVMALKSYYLNTLDYIKNFNEEETFDFIITNASKFVKNLNFFNCENKIKLDLVYKQLAEDENVMHVRSAQFSNGKLKISCVGAEEFKIRDINKVTLESRLNIKNSKWSFKISKEDFLDIKKLCSINSEDRILNIDINNGKVTINESGKWEMEVDEIEPMTTQLTFIKKYLSNINTNQEFINFSIFETFILVKDDNSNLLLSFETDFDGES